jgi:hypothetical protein
MIEIAYLELAEKKTRHKLKFIILYLVERGYQSEEDVVQLNQLIIMILYSYSLVFY